MFDLKDEDAIKAIIKLNKDTARGKVAWTTIASSYVVLAHDGEVIGKVYRTPIGNKYFQLFRYRYKDYSMDFDSLYWSSQVQLEITDISGTQEWEFPHDNALNDLYETVRLKSGNVDDLLSSFLNE